MENKTKAILAVGSAAVIALSGLGGAIIADDSAQVQALQEQVAVLNAREPVVVTETIEVPVEVPVEVEKVVEVAVDNDNLDLVLDHLYDNNGEVSYLTNDLKDDEVEQIVDRVVFINDVKALAADYVKDEGIDELDKEVVDGVELDDRDVERFKVYDDAEDIVIDDVDFEDSDADVLVKARFEQDDVDYIAWFKVEFRDGEIDDFVIDSVEVKE